MTRIDLNVATGEVTEHDDPLITLLLDRGTIPADGTTAAVVTYVNTGPDAPDEVTFTANGATATVPLDAEGNASLDVVSNSPGDTVTVTVDAYPDDTITVYVEES